MKPTNLLQLISLGFFLGCIALTGFAQSKKSGKSKPQLVFQTGFEGSTRVVPHGADANDIVGKDKKLPKSDWEKLQTNYGIENVWVNYTGGDSTKRYAKIIPEPGNPKNKVLQFWLADGWAADGGQVKSRVQVEFHAIKGGYKEFYQSVRVFLTEDFNAMKTYPHRIPWCTISEFWNNEWWIKGEKYGFRVTLGIGKPTAEASDLYFILNAENPGQKEVWEADNNVIKVPIGKWFTLEYYFLEGNKETGRFWVAITPEGGERQIVADVHNFTHMTLDPAPNGMTGYNPMKLYTDKNLVRYVTAQGKTLQVYWDDFKLWKNKRP